MISFHICLLSPLLYIYWSKAGQEDTHKFPKQVIPNFTKNLQSCEIQKHISSFPRSNLKTPSCSWRHQESMPSIFKARRTLKQLDRVSPVKQGLLYLKLYIYALLMFLMVWFVFSMSIRAGGTYSMRALMLESCDAIVRASQTESFAFHNPGTFGKK